MAKIKLTESIIKDICTRIKAGAFENVACESAGIPVELFDEWVLRGTNPKCKNKLQKQLVRGVRQAKAHARFIAETKIRQEDPKFWLLHGPGKETTEYEGWTKPLPANKIKQTNKTVNVMMNPEVNKIIASMMEILLPFPEARAALARSLAGDSEEQPRRIEGTVEE